ncbi:MAG: hypothetical protein Q4C70_15710, partial [Planctomycetia bacterium]|nr:hypothetical protein [Planctomycetia bacterium]
MALAIIGEVFGNGFGMEIGESNISGNSENGVSETLSLMNGFRFEIPIIPSSRLELLVPASLNSLEFPTALGAQNFDQTARKWTVQLGSTSSLAVQWKAPSLRGSGNGALMVDELYSWELGNENRTLHCRYRFRAREGTCSRMEWTLDPSLNFNAENVEVFLWKEYAVAPYHEILLTDQRLRQLVPYAGKKEVTSRLEGKNRRVTLTLAEAVQEPILVRFSLTSAGAGNAGSYVLPSIRTEKTRVMRRWFQIAGESNCQLSFKGMMIDTANWEAEHLVSLNWQNHSSSTTQPIMTQDGSSSSVKNGLSGEIPTIAIQEFASAWEEFTPMTSPEIPSASIIPAFILDDTAGVSQSQLWVIHSQPLPAISTVQETLSYAFDKDTVHVNYTIQFPSTESIPALFHLKIPENLNVEKILLHDTQQKNLRYSRNHLTEVAIFYDRYGDSGETGRTEGEIPDGSTGYIADGSTGGITGNTRVTGDSRNTGNTENTGNVTNSVTSDGNKNLPRRVTECKIEITGTMELAGPVGGEELRVPFPKIRILGGALYSTSRIIRLYRTPSVLVTNHLENSSGELLISGTLTEGEPLFLFENVRWVATFSVEPQEEIRGFLVVMPNQPQIQMSCRTFLKMPREMD